MKKTVNTSIIVPAYNEEEGLAVVLDKIFKVVDANCEVIVVDDGSVDNTAKVAANYNVMLMVQEVNKGKGEALKAGIEAAKGENVIWIDADDSYPAEMIPKVIKAFDDYDVVVCSRKYGRGRIPRFNRVGNWLFRTMIRGIYGFKGFDPCTGLYGVKKRYLKKMKLVANRFAIEPEISIKCGRMRLKTLDMPIKYQSRVGSTKLNAIKVGFEDMWCILSLIFWTHKSVSDKEQQNLSDLQNISDGEY